jgi:hypothetical protein
VSLKKRGSSGAGLGRNEWNETTADPKAAGDHERGNNEGHLFVTEHNAHFMDDLGD